jgi:hypothetical protein
LNPKHLVKIMRVFAGPTAKNGHQPPRSVSAGHIHVGVDDDAPWPLDGQRRGAQLGLIGRSGGCGLHNGRYSGRRNGPPLKQLG